jgi:hypothetical protein
VLEYLGGSADAIAADAIEISSSSHSIAEGAELFDKELSAGPERAQKLALRRWPAHAILGVLDKAKSLRRNSACAGRFLFLRW